MPVQLFREKDIFPSDEVLKNTPGVAYPVISRIFSEIIPELSLNPEWNYYNDGKAWLCKVCFKKKTVFWLSIWEGLIRTGFYFTEKHLADIAELDIEEQIKTDFCLSKNIGRLIPMIIDIDSDTRLQDLQTVARYKINCK